YFKFDVSPDDTYITVTDYDELEKRFFIKTFYKTGEYDSIIYNEAREDGSFRGVSMLHYLPDNSIYILTKADDSGKLLSKFDTAGYSAFNIKLPGSMDNIPVGIHLDNEMNLYMPDNIYNTEGKVIGESQKNWSKIFRTVNRGLVYIGRECTISGLLFYYSVNYLTNLYFSMNSFTAELPGRVISYGDTENGDIIIITDNNGRTILRIDRAGSVRNKVILDYNTEKFVIKKSGRIIFPIFTGKGIEFWQVKI
ncbi:MAG: hypothetical protein KAS39_06970, partial [Actinomycetia bacterium]|nr:hypothetical protein [Actinomycetes bacterium]